MKTTTCTLVLLLICSSNLGAADFFDLGSGLVSTVSTDGSTVIGRNLEPNRVAFRWTEESGLIELGTLPGHMSSGAHGVSADGMVVVGESSRDTGAPQPFIWTSTLR